MAGYLGASPVPQTIQKKQSFTATASQTTFTTTGYTDGQFINVYLNGVRLINGTDYTATNGSDIVLTTAASASDVLDFETFNEFTLVDQTLETPTFRTSATLKNDTEEDTDGGRESTLIFKGEQSGGEISTLAEIEASHDGTADDEKGDLIFRTNDGSDGTSPTEAMRIDSSQNVGIGTSPASFFSGGNQLVVGNGSGAQGLTIYAESTNHGQILFADGTTGNQAYRGIVRYDHVTDSIRVMTEGASERLRIDSDGVKFNGDTAAANALNDYEEGTYTHTITGSTSGSWTPRSGYTSLGYTKIGRLVVVSGQLETQGTKTASGNIQVSLPFAIASGQSMSTGAAFPLRNNGTSLEGTNYVNLSQGQSHFIMTNLNHAGTLTVLNDSHLDSAWEGKLLVVYQTDA